MNLSERIAAGESPRAIVEHELRGPLAVIVGYAELLRARDGDAVRVEAADAITEAVMRLSRLIGEVGELIERYDR